MRILESVESINSLTEKLGAIPVVSQYDSDDEPEAASLAWSLSELEGSFLTFLTELLPRLTDTSASLDDAKDALFDIRDEFLHVLYHLRDPRFFDDIFELEAEFDHGRKRLDDAP
jgi:hypothetical protein